MQYIFQNWGTRTPLKLNNSKFITQDHLQFSSMSYFVYDLLCMQVLHDTKDKNLFFSQKFQFLWFYYLNQ